jgi:hypothetical protein
MARSQDRNTGTPQEFSRRNHARAVGDDLLAHAKQAFLKAGFPDLTLVTRWQEIAGDDVFHLAKPLRWQEGAEGAVLTLKCDSGAAVFLQHETRALIERLNAYLGPGRIARLRFMPGKMDDGAAQTPLPEHPHLAQMAGISAVGAGDEGLVSALDRLGRLRQAARLKPRR